MPSEVMVWEMEWDSRCLILHGVRKREVERDIFGPRKARQH